MINKEYEYSFKVLDLNPFIGYCIENNYVKTEEVKEIRKIYKKLDGTMARTTTKIVDGKEKKFLDFKEDNSDDEILKERKESLAIKYDTEKEIDSILEFLKYKYFITLNRTRWIYEKDSIKFELDFYNSPENMFVVAIEGSKDLVDKIYEEISKKFEDIMLK